MPTIKDAKCINCQKLYQITLKRFNESVKNNWKFYCSKRCLSEHRNKQVVVVCNNPDCNKTFKSSSNTKIKNHYCSSSCAAKVNNLGMQRNLKGNVANLIYRKHEKTDKEILVKVCAIPNCNNLISFKNTYCSNKCHAKTLQKSNKFYINKIKSFYYSNNRLPVKREFDGSYGIIRSKFGSWNKAIKAAGFEPNPVLFAHKHTAKDGHKCDSLAEKIIDDWLFSKGIPHTRNMPYPTNSKLTCDFIVNDIWIEFFGLSGQVRRYDELVYKKLQIIKTHNLKFIPIYPQQLFPKPMLHEIFASPYDYLFEY